MCFASYRKPLWCVFIIPIDPDFISRFNWDEVCLNCFLILLKFVCSIQLLIFCYLNQVRNTPIDNLTSYSLAAKSICNIQYFLIWTASPLYITLRQMAALQVLLKFYHFLTNLTLSPTLVHLRLFFFHQKIYYTICIL